jgi:hypothetical protein
VSAEQGLHKASLSRPHVERCRSILPCARQGGSARGFASALWEPSRRIMQDVGAMRGWAPRAAQSRGGDSGPAPTKTLLTLVHDSPVFRFAGDCTCLPKDTAQEEGAGLPRWRLTEVAAVCRYLPPQTFPSRKVRLYFGVDGMLGGIFARLYSGVLQAPERSSCARGSH